MLLFVPNGADAEVQVLTLRNGSKRNKRLVLTSFVEWCLWNAQDDGTLVRVARGEKKVVLRAVVG